jgi:membrane protease YdiL (CAAX protease family)
MTDAPAVSPPELRRTARRGLTIYFVIVVVLSGGLEAYIWMNPSTLGTLVLPLMWTPALASVIARLILREGFSDVSFRFGGLRTWRWYAVGLAMPLVVGVVAYGVAWLTGLVGFQGDTTTVLRGVAYAATAATLVNLLSTTGEEVGWRGYMLTRLIDAGTPRPVLVGGLIWAVWHLPLIFAGVYAAGSNRMLSAVLFVGSVVSISFVFSRMRLETGSVWPVVYAHATWNAIIQGPFDGASTGPDAALWTGESGILVVVALAAFAAFASRGRWTYIRRLPGVGVPLSRVVSTSPARPTPH